MYLLLERLLDLLLHVFYHVPIWGRFAPPYNYLLGQMLPVSSFFFQNDGKVGNLVDSRKIGSANEGSYYFLSPLE